MKVECPHCHFSREIDDSALPPLPCKVTCPKCGQSFTLEPEQQGVVTPPPIEPPPVVEPPPAVEPPSVDAAAPEMNRPPGNGFAARREEPAGFWIRVLAAIIDSVLCNILVFVMGFSVGMLLNLTHNYMSPDVQLLLMVMGIVVTVFYYVFFTGYGGQTPGKMAMRIKVIHRDGGDIGFGQAFVRETIGKTISYLIFCIGYLMVGLRSDKRGLHDLIAATRVIKI